MNTLSLDSRLAVGNVIIANVEISDKEAGQGRHPLQGCAGATALGGLLAAIIIPEFFCVNNTP